MMKLSKKFVLGLGLILIANSLFAIEIENLKNSDNEQTKVTQKCAIDNQSSDYKKAFFEKIADCCRNSSERYVDDFHNNVPKFIRIQCDNCGGCLNMTKSLKRAEFGEKTKGEFSKERFLEWKLERQSERSEIYNFTEYINYTKSNHYLHRTHLRSEYWKNIRQLVLDRDKGICQSCKTEKAKDVHHLTYKNLGNETIDELISYCRACHEKAHGK